MTDLGERYAATARGPGMRLLGRCLAFLPVVLPLLAGAASTPVSREYQVKAAFLYNFAKFVAWPPERFPSEESPLVLGVLGENPFGRELELGVADRRANNRPFEVRYLDTADDAGDVHIVFVAAGEEHLLMNGSLESLHEASVLTIGESRAFKDRGGIITFTLRDDRIRFFINRTAVEEASLSVHAQLLRLALEEE